MSNKSQASGDVTFNSLSNILIQKMEIFGRRSSFYHLEISTVCAVWLLRFFQLESSALGRMSASVAKQDFTESFGILYFNSFLERPHEDSG